MRITAQALNRSTLARQMLLRREALGVTDAVRRVVAMQAQHAASPYLALWNRIAPFDRADLDVAFARGDVVKATLMRITLYAVQPDDYRAFREAMEPTLRASRLNDNRFRVSGLTVGDVKPPDHPMAQHAHTIHALDRDLRFGYSDSRARGSKAEGSLDCMIVSSWERSSYRSRAVAVLSLLGLQVALFAPASPAGATSAARTAESPLPAAGQLAGISCSSRSSCWAVGLTNPGQWESQLEMVHWNGIAWTSVPSPITGEDVSAGQAPDGLSSFICPGKNSCWAVGSTARRDLILHWNGQTWSVEYSRGYETLSGVTCASEFNCWAVGTWLAHTGAYEGARGTSFSVILHWTGQGWSSVPSPNPSRVAADSGCTLVSCYSNQLSSVACVSARLCWAVDVYMIQGQQGQHSPEVASKIVRWNGVRWSVVRTPDPMGNLMTVTCSSKTSCWALGSTAVGQTPAHLVALFWNGKAWSLVPTDNVPPLVPTYPFAEGRTTMSCRSAADCWVVGVRFPGACGTTSHPIAIHWNGRTWSDKVGTLPAGALLVGVTLTANDRWAVGQDRDGSQDIFRWDGSRWSSLRQSGSTLFAPSQAQGTRSGC